MSLLCRIPRSRENGASRERASAMPVESRIDYRCQLKACRLLARTVRYCSASECRRSGGGPAEEGPCMDGARGARGIWRCAKRSGAAMLGWTAPLSQVAAWSQDRVCDSDNGGGT